MAFLNQKNAEDTIYTYYVLKLQDNKYYVGRTMKTLDDRFVEHLTGIGSAWTKKYPPLEVVESFSGDKWQEDALVKNNASKMPRATLASGHAGE